MMEGYVYLLKNDPLEKMHKITNSYSKMPFMLFIKCIKPFKALGESKDGYYFSSPYFAVKNQLLNSFCIELMVLEPVGIDGCLVEYPESFYSLRTTKSSIIVSTVDISGIQLFTSKYVNCEIRDYCSKDG